MANLSKSFFVRKSLVGVRPKTNEGSTISTTPTLNNMRISEDLGILLGLKSGGYIGIQEANVPNPEVFEAGTINETIAAKAAELGGDSSEFEAWWNEVTVPGFVVYRSNEEDGAKLASPTKNEAGGSLNFACAAAYQALGGVDSGTKAFTVLEDEDRIMEVEGTKYYVLDLASETFTAKTERKSGAEKESKPADSFGDLNLEGTEEEEEEA